MQKYEPLMRVKLSKKFFLELKEGLFLASNCFNEKDRPIFAEEVWPLTVREMQWQMIVDCGANHRFCEVFESRAAFEETHFDRVLKMRMGEL
jgi:hypothetical protein